MRVSVCLATFNGEKFIEEQVCSIMKQLGDKDELIISDNGSTDNTLTILQKFDDPRIKIYECSVKGVSINFQNSIMQSSGEFVFLSDQDDIWIPGRLEEGMRLLNNSDVASVGLRFIDENGIEIGRPDLIPTGGVLRTLISNSYPGCSLSIKRDFLNKLMPFPKRIPMHDWWIVLMCMCFGKMNRSREAYILYRRHENNVSDTGGVSKETLIIRMKWRFVLVFEIIKTLLRSIFMTRLS